MTVSDDTSQSLTQVKASDFTLALDGGFADGGVSGTFTIDVTQQSGSAITDDQAMHNGVVTVHNYHEVRTSSGHDVMAFTVAGPDFSFSYTMDSTRGMERTRDGTLASERTTTDLFADTSTTSAYSYVDGYGATQNQSSWSHTLTAGDWDLTRWFNQPSNRGADRDAASVTVGGFNLTTTEDTPNGSLVDQTVAQGDDLVHTTTSTWTENGQTVTSTDTTTEPITTGWADYYAPHDVRFGLERHTPATAIQLLLSIPAAVAQTAAGLLSHALFGAQPGPESGAIYDTGTNADGSYWIYEDDGNHWSYAEYDVSNTQTYFEEGWRNAPLSAGNAALMGYAATDAALDATEHTPPASATVKSSGSRTALRSIRCRVPGRRPTSARCCSTRWE